MFVGRSWSSRERVRRCRSSLRLSGYEQEVAGKVASGGVDLLDQRLHQIDGVGSLLDGEALLDGERSVTACSFVAIW